MTPCCQPDPAHGSLGRREQQGRQQRQAEGKEEEVAARVLARDEELGGVAQDVQQRLRQGQRPEDGQMRARDADA